MREITPYMQMKLSVRVLYLFGSDTPQRGAAVPCRAVLCVRRDEQREQDRFRILCRWGTKVCKNLDTGEAVDKG